MDPGRARGEQLLALAGGVGDAEQRLGLGVAAELLPSPSSSSSGIEASQSSQIRATWPKLAIGITPGMIGTSIPRSRAAATKSK